MRGVRIPHDLNGPDRFLFGLSVGKIAILMFGMLAGYGVWHLDAPGVLRVPLAVVIVGVTGALTWIRPAGQSLSHWAIAALEYQFAGRRPQLEIAPSKPSHQIRLTVVQPNQRERSGSAVLRETEHSGARTHAVDDDVVEIEETEPAITVAAEENIARSLSEPVPVYMGNPQVIAFYSTKGGTGRTTLATEIATLLARTGWYRDNPQRKARPLKVALVDLDVGSANVSVRLGLAQPTILDYLADVSTPPARLVDFVVEHERSGLRVLLGSPKCLTAFYPHGIGVPQAAHILSELKAQGYQFLFVDMASTLGDLEAYLLQSADRILCVVTPTAGSIQDLYRAVEALRRLGLGQKLGYVANKMKARWDLSEPLNDLGGTLAASIPWDPVLEAAENRHEPFSLEASGPTADALYRLATFLYPALPLRSDSRTAFGPLSWFGRRRHAG